MKGKPWIRALACLALLGSAGFASAIPVAPEDAVRVGGFYVNSGRVDSAFLQYDSSTGRMTYRAGGGGFTNFDSGLPRNEDGLLAWTATVDRYGQIQGEGAMSLSLDLGNGIELLAIGKVVEFGWAVGPVCRQFGSEPPFCAYREPRVAIEMDYVDSRIEPYMGNFWLFVGSMNQNQLGSEPLLQSFVCGPDCHYSGDSIWGYQVAVPEPSATVLMVLGLFGLRFAGRHRRRLS